MGEVFARSYLLPHDTIKEQATLIDISQLRIHTFHWRMKTTTQSGSLEH